MSKVGVNEVSNHTSQKIIDAVRSRTQTPYSMGANNGILSSVLLDGEQVQVFVPNGQDVTEQHFIELVCLEKSYIDAKKERFLSLFSEIAGYAIKHNIKMMFESVGERMSMTLTNLKGSDDAGFKVSTIVKNKSVMVTGGAAAALNLLKTNFPA